MSGGFRKEEIKGERTIYRTRLVEGDEWKKGETK